MRLATIIIIGALFGCAQASDRSGDPGPDASSGFPDGSPLPPLPDAAPLPDGHSAGTPDAMPQTGGPDAAIDPGLFCTSSTQCGVPGECCFFLIQPPGFCVPGEELPVLGCVPSD